MMRPLKLCWLRKDEGSSILEMALVMPVLLLLLVTAVDLGQAYYTAIEVASAAHAGALYGIQNPTDVTGMVAASRLDAINLPSIQPVATYGCECLDGSSVVPGCGSAPSCSYNIVDYVELDTTATFTPILRYPGLPSTFVLSSKSRMRASHW